MNFNEVLLDFFSEVKNYDMYIHTVNEFHILKSPPHGRRVDPSPAHRYTGAAQASTASAGRRSEGAAWLQPKGRGMYRSAGGRLWALAARRLAPELRAADVAVRDSRGGGGALRDPSGEKGASCPSPPCATLRP